jgi:signal transduction histidine kinase/CheY-like chemotaxis protein
MSTTSRQAPLVVAAFFGDMVALAGAALLVGDARALVAGGTYVPVATDAALIVAGLAAHLTARSRWREAQAAALVVMVLAAGPAALLAHRTWISVAAGVCVAVLAPHLLVPARARLWVAAGALLALTALDIGWVQAAVASGGVLVAGLLSLGLARRLGIAAGRAAQDSERALEAERVKVADLEARFARIHGGERSPQRSSLRVALTRRLGAMGAVASVIARDLRRAAAAGDAWLLDAALRSASRAEQVARLASGGAAREERTTLGLLWPRVSEQLGGRLGAAHHVHWKVPVELPPVTGSAPEWTHVLSALAENALQAMSQGGAVTIEAAVSDAAGHARVVVSDNGPGIPPDRLPHLLEPLTAAHADDEGEGIGLGLIASMIETMEGTVAITSAAGRGTTIELTVPFYAAPVAAIVPAPKLEGTVLLADDNRDVRQVVRRFLEGFGLGVVEASSGNSALALFAEGPDRFRVLVLDVVMSGTPVEEVVVRARELRPNVPIVLMSGYDVSGLLEGVLSLGGVRFHAKPLTPEAVFATLQDLFTIRNA